MACRFLILRPKYIIVIIWCHYFGFITKLHPTLIHFLFFNMNFFLESRRGWDTYCLSSVKNFFEKKKFHPKHHSIKLHLIMYLWEYYMFDRIFQVSSEMTNEECSNVTWDSSKGAFSSYTWFSSYSRCLYQPTVITSPEPFNFNLYLFKVYGKIWHFDIYCFCPHTWPGENSLARCGISLTAHFFYSIHFW